jgi:hypothetical protein
VSIDEIIQLREEEKDDDDMVEIWPLGERALAIAKPRREDQAPV